jgi:uncharacterized protein involved in exopolysaccharide biosynthesis
MQITPAQIGENMVQSTISNSLNERIQQMETQILSRTELSSIINDPRLQLYKDELKTKPLEDVIDEMKRAIGIQFVALPGALGRRATAFDISFSYNDRYKAQQTVSALMNKFDEENLNTQKTDQDAVKGFVGDLLSKAKADLSDAYDKLTAFKEGNAGKLPEQVGLNIARESGYTSKIQSDTDQLYRDNQALTSLENQKDDAKHRLEFFETEQAQIIASMPTGGAAAQQNQDLVALDKTIDSLEFNLQQLQRSFKPDYPPIKTAQKQLLGYREKRDELEKKIEAKAAADAAKAATEAAKPKNEALLNAANLRDAEARDQYDTTVKHINAQEDQIRQDIERVTKEQESYKTESGQIDQMLKDSTGLEAQYEELRRNQTMAEGAYQDLLNKQRLAEANSQLIQRKAGEILDVLDNASLPVQPTKPNRTMIIGSGFAMSFILGLGMAGLQEAKDTSLKNLKDVRAYTNLPVLCSIPLLENTMLVKRKRRLTYLAWSAAVLVGAAAVSASVVYYYTITMKT